jgi:outer membrane protein TolC
VIAQMSADLARAKVAALEERVTYQKAAVSSGMALDVAEREARVKYLQARHALLEKEGEYDDLSYTLRDVVGLPVGTTLQLQVPAAVETRPAALEQYVADALNDNPEVLEARALVKKASHGVGAARADYIPQLGLMGMHFYQNSLPFFPKNTLAVGAVGSFTLFDFGARRSTLNARKAQLRQAESNLTMVEGRVRGEVEAAYRKVSRSWELVELAREGKELRVEGARLKTMASNVGYAVNAEARDAASDRLEAELDFVKAQLGYRIALAELAKASGQLNF